MSSSKPVSVVKRGAGISGLRKSIRELKNSEVYVGIPAEHAVRKDGEINNASLLYIQEHGSPVNNIPPRPVLQPAINRAMKPIQAELALAARSVMEVKPDDATRHLNRAGLIAANAAKRYFTEDNGWAPNAPSTIAAKGSSKPLIDSGEMRRSISYLVSEKGVRHSPPPFIEQVAEVAEDIVLELIEGAAEVI